MARRKAVALTFLAVIVALGGRADSAQAQCMWDDPPCVDTTDPVIQISPANGVTFTSSNSVAVEINWSDDFALDTGYRIIKLNGGSPVSWPYTAHSASSGTSSGTIQLTPGTNTVYASICDASSNCNQKTVSYTYNPPPQLQAHAAPVLSLAMHHSEISVPSPFDGVASYTTPAYVSLDESRAVTLVYNSSRAAPTAFVQVDAVDNSTTNVVRMELQVKDSTGSVVHLFGDSTKQVAIYTAKHGSNRLAAQWNMTNAGTGAYKYTVTVKTVFSDAITTQSSDTIRVVVDQ